VHIFIVIILCLAGAAVVGILEFCLISSAIIFMHELCFMFSFEKQNIFKCSDDDVIIDSKNPVALLYTCK